MKMFRVVATHKDCDVYHVKAETKVEAMNMVLDDEAGAPIDFIEGDYEVYYPGHHGDLMNLTEIS